MNPTLKELLILTPLLLLVSYALMRLFVWLRRFRKKPGKPDCWQRRSGTWCVCMSVVSFITLSVIVQEVELVTVWVLLYYFITFLFFAAFFSIAARHKDDEYVPRDSAPGARSGCFYAAVLAELTVLPAATFVLCRCFGTFVPRALLGWMPVALALSALLLNLTVARSNAKTHRDVHDPWSRFALVYFALVAAAYPLCHGFAVSIDEKLRVDDDWFSLWSVFGALFVGGAAYCAIRTFYGAMNHEPPEETRKELPGLFSDGSYTPPPVRPSEKTPLSDPMDLYRSSYEDPDKAREDVFRQYDESRRISEDIHQFHNANPEADLSDHYYWEDVLDAESNDYLEDDPEDA
ncbi:MAG: hypothetical protein K6F25_08000 [Bacteroidales bacterium]|nr:hypothetical protein [Bacteroidales bacterium]